MNKHGKFNKFSVNQEVVRTCRQGKLLDKDSLLYHIWRIFWVTDDIVNRIKIFRVLSSDKKASFFTSGSLHPINSEVIEVQNLSLAVQTLDRSLYDYAVVVQDGVLIKHFMDFWIYVNFQIHLLEHSNKNKSENSVLTILKLNPENSYQNTLPLMEEFETLLIPANDPNNSLAFIGKYHEYSLQRVYLLNNDEMEMQPVNLEPHNLFCVSSGLKPASYFSSMQSSLKKVYFCDYSPFALNFWKELISKNNIEETLELFEKYSARFIGSSPNAKEASKVILHDQIHTYFKEDKNFFNLLNSMSEKAEFLKVDIIKDLEFLKISKDPYYFWFSNSYERNLTLLSESKEQHLTAHHQRLQNLKNIHNDKVFYNESNYDFRISDIESPFALGTSDIRQSSPVKWIEFIK